MKRERVPSAFSTSDLDRLFSGLDQVEALVLAVSGGPDSMALMLLAARWAHAFGKTAPALHVATVDHGLRPEARDEARLVADAAADLGLPCATLVWTGAKPATRIQERARTARYTLLVEHARTVGAEAILTAHHADDQTETILLRLGRGSGLRGLAGMRRETTLAPDIRLVRPLLEIAKSRLVDECRSAGVPVVADPSNADPAFARSRLRTQAAALDRLGLDRDRLTQLARRMARADAALEAETDRVEARLAPTRAPGRYGVKLATARETQPEILLRLMHRSIVHIAGGERPVRLDRLEALTAVIEAALRKGHPHRATLGGAVIALAADATLEVTREPPRRRGRPPKSEAAA